MVPEGAVQVAAASKEELLAELEGQREKRDTLKEMGKRVREDILPWNAASGVFKRAKTA